MCMCQQSVPRPVGSGSLFKGSGNHSKSVLLDVAWQPNLLRLNNLEVTTVAYSNLVLSKYFMLYIHAGSPSVTSLTYNNRSRTLTCTSTGGPATTVTWRRNGVVVTTHQQTKTLVDRVKGTYRMVLAIDSSVGPSGLAGNYSCTVGVSSKSIVVTGKT